MFKKFLTDRFKERSTILQLAQLGIAATTVATGIPFEVVAGVVAATGILAPDTKQK